MMFSLGFNLTVVVFYLSEKIGSHLPVKQIVHNSPEVLSRFKTQIICIFMAGYRVKLINPEGLENVIGLEYSFTICT